MVVKKSLCLKCAIEFSPGGDKAVKYEDMRICCNNKVQVREELMSRSLEVEDSQTESKWNSKQDSEKWKTEHKEIEGQTVELGWDLVFDLN